MGRRGPQRTSTEDLVGRGSWLGKARKKAEAGEAASGNGRREPKKPQLHFKPFRLTKKRIEKICRGGINGYDPWATADPGQYFDAAAARKVIKFFHTELVHIEGKLDCHGFELEVWEIAAIGCLFGWKNADGSRRYRTVMWFVPRKNGKTPIAAGVILWGLTRDGEAGAQIYGGAKSYEQASLIFRHARGMVERSEWMSQDCQIFKGQAKAIELTSDHSRYKVVASEGLAAHGWTTHIGVIDELHAQKDGELKEAFETSVASANRFQPLLMYLTTSDYDHPSVCNEEVDYAMDIKLGRHRDSTYLPVMYYAEPDDDWELESTAEKANPNIDVSVDRAYLRQLREKAKRSPAKLNSYKRLHLNLRTTTDTVWLKPDQWDLMARPDMDMTGKRCFGALDLSSTRDITAWGMLFPLPDGFYYFKPCFWAPQAKIQSHEAKLSDRVDYPAWHTAGWIRQTPGNTIDYERVRADIAGRPGAPGRGREGGFAQQYDIVDIAVDRLFQGEETSQQLMRMGFEERVVAFGQGFMSMAAPTKRWDELYYSGKILHDGNPVMRWMVANAVIEFDAAGNMKASKKLSSGKIDGLVTGIMCLGRAMVSPEEESPYKHRGVRSI